MKIPFEYKILFPTNMEEGKKYPVIYVMHGRGTNEQDILPLVEELQNDFILIGIRGGVTEGPGFSYFLNISHGNPDRVSFDSCVKNLESFLNYAGQTYPIDSSQQYLLGFSQGAILSMTLAITVGIKIKGIIALNGYVPQFVKEEYAKKPLDNVSIYISHGEYDHVYPIEIGIENHRFFEQWSNKVHFTSYPVGHGVSYENKKDFIEWLYEDMSHNPIVG